MMCPVFPSGVVCALGGVRARAVSCGGGLGGCKTTKTSCGNLMGHCALATANFDGFVYVVAFTLSHIIAPFPVVVEMFLDAAKGVAKGFWPRRKVVTIS